MQNAKDSFYMVLRERLAVINPQRTTLVRGTVRPGILVEEAEASSSQIPDEVFLLRWGTLGVDAELATTLVASECEIVYQSCGTQAYGGLDRGRALATMDKELRSMLEPSWTAKRDYAHYEPVELGTRVFWDEATFGPVVSQRDRMSRTVKVMVYSYEEQGE